MDLTRLSRTSLRRIRWRTAGSAVRQHAHGRSTAQRLRPLVSRYRQLDEPLDLEALNLELARWLALTAHARVHGTTGEVPSERLEKERAALQALPPARLAGLPRPSQAVRTLTTPFPVQRLQHPLSVYDDLLESV